MLSCSVGCSVSDERADSVALSGLLVDSQPLVEHLPLSATHLELGTPQALALISLTDNSGCLSAGQG